MTPLTSPRLAELVNDRLLSLMRSGEWSEGTRIPPERELSELLGVSRTIVREALSALQLAGFVERRPGVGTVVTRTPTSGIGLDSYLDASVSITGVLEARLALELGVTHLLCARRDPDLGEAIEILNQMRLAVRQESKADQYIVPSLDFHVAVVSATEEPLLVAMQVSLVDLMRPHLWLLAEKYDLDLAEKSLAIHERMLYALERQDLVAALAEVKAHYRPYPLLSKVGTTQGMDTANTREPEVVSGSESDTSG